MVCLSTGPRLRNPGMALPEAPPAEPGRGAPERHRGRGSRGSGSQGELTRQLSGILSRRPLHRGRCWAPQPSLLSNFREKLIKRFKRLVNYNSRST